MTKNTYKTITPEDVRESINRFKVQVIQKYKDRFNEATLELRKVAKEREESRNVMHDIGLKNKMDILQAERHSLDFCIRTIREQK